MRQFVFITDARLFAKRGSNRADMWPPSGVPETAGTQSDTFPLRTTLLTCLCMIRHQSVATRSTIHYIVPIKISTLDKTPKPLRLHAVTWLLGYFLAYPAATPSGTEPGRPWLGRAAVFCSAVGLSRDSISGRNRSFPTCPSPTQTEVSGRGCGAISGQNLVSWRRSATCSPASQFIGIHYSLSTLRESAMKLRAHTDRSS